MLVVLIGAVPKFTTERLEDPGGEISSQITFTEDISSIVTEVNELPSTIGCFVYGDVYKPVIF